MIEAPGELHLTHIGLNSLPAELDTQTWTEQMLGLARIHQLEPQRPGLYWALGDTWIAGPTEPGAKIQALKQSDWQGPSPKWLKLLAVICRRFSPAQRRQVLTFNHHVAVYALPQPHRSALLDRAEAEALSLPQIRAIAQAIRDALPIDNKGLYEAFMASSHTLGGISSLSDLSLETLWRLTATNGEKYLEQLSETQRKALLKAVDRHRTAKSAKDLALGPQQLELAFEI